MLHEYLFPDGMELTAEKAAELLAPALDEVGTARRVIAIPPDITRFHSCSGPILSALYRRYGSALTDVLPALGTHAPMTGPEIGRMYPGVPQGLFRVHDWRTGLANLGEVGSDEIERLSEGKLHYPWPVQVDSRLVDGNYDAIFSIGQVVPHEVVGMANHAKNIFVGLGGPGGINGSHFLGAVYGLERIMGRADTPVRELFSIASRRHASAFSVSVSVITRSARISSISSAS
jgi:nickel-dependent lactate racemase